MEVAAKRGEISRSTTYLTGDLPIPCSGPYEEDADGEGSGCVALGHPVASASFGSPREMTGARRTSLSDRSGVTAWGENSRAWPAADAKAPPNALETWPGIWPAGTPR